MTLDAEDKAWLRATIAEIVRPAAADTPILPRLTIDQFGCAVELHADTVARKIRTHEIPAKFVTDGRPKKISPAALALFNVTPPEALARLAAHNLAPRAPQSAGSAPGISVHPVR